MVFVIICNDFDESLIKYMLMTNGYHYFSVSEEGVFKLGLIDYQLPTLKKLLRRSSFLRYVKSNLELIRNPRFFRDVKFSSTDDLLKKYVGNTLADASLERVSDAKGAIDEFFRQLPLRTGLTPKNILFVVDGMRPHTY